MLAETLKSELKKALAHDGGDSAESYPTHLIPHMLTHIGAPDPELRDELIYGTLGSWILEKQALSAVQMTTLFMTALDENHMGYQLGEHGTDSVFKRSFSTLVLPLVLIAHRETPFLSADAIRHAKDRVIAYLAAERDWRGFVPEKGWAHAIAHAADAVDDLGLATELNSADLLELLAAVRTVMSTSSTVFTHEEDERMSIAVVNLLPRLDSAEITNWLAGFETLRAEVLDAPFDLYRAANMKQFLRSVYFRLQRDGVEVGDSAEIISRSILDTLTAIQRF